MPSVPYMNQSAPFWDFIANFERNFEQQPSRGENSNAARADDPQSEQQHPSAPPPFGPWAWGFPGFTEQGFSHRSHGPHGQSNVNQEGDKENENGKDAADNGEGSSTDQTHSNGHNHCGRRGRGGHGPLHHHGHRHGHGYGNRGSGWGGPWGPRGACGRNFDPLNIAATLFEQAQGNKDNKEESNDDFTPDADVFDAPGAFVVHVSLPGANKEDIGVNWDAEKSELSIAGVIYRPGGEELLKTLAMSERKAGPFNRKIRLGTRASPAQIDADMITAKLEDGVLKIDVPKMVSDFVEVRKVEIQ